MTSMCAYLARRLMEDGIFVIRKSQSRAVSRTGTVPPSKMLFLEVPAMVFFGEPRAGQDPA